MTVDDSKTDEDAARSDADTARRRRTKAVGAWIRRQLSRWRPIVLLATLISSTGIAAGLFVVDYRPDQQTDKSAAREVIRAASEGAVALLSYSPDSLTRDFENAKRRLTVDYQSYYNQFTAKIVAPAAQRGQMTTTARVIRAAVSELHRNSAVVLLFIEQKTSSKEKPNPLKTTDSVRVTLIKVKGAWLIDKFDSV